MNYTAEQEIAICGCVEALERGDSVSLEAPAGSGKTACVLEIAKRTGARVITFTRKAAQELRDRGADATTIYALCAEHMDHAELLRTVTDDVYGEMFTRWSKVHSIARTGKHRARAELLFERQGLGLLRTSEMLSSFPLGDRPLIVDEAQDITEDERQAIETAREDGQGVCYVGDRWQMIYEWRGAVDMAPADFCLTRNFRSCQGVVDAIADISNRAEHGDNNLANGITAWLCRTNREVRLLSEALGVKGVHGWSREALADCYIAAAAELGVDWARSYHETDDYSDLYTLHRLPFECRTPMGFLRWMRVRDLQDQITTEPVQVMTIHASKGLQFGRVCAVAWPRLLESNATGVNPDCENQRLWYVACSRAMQALVQIPDLYRAMELAETAKEGS